MRCVFIVLMVVFASGCSSLRHTRTTAGTVFLGRDYQGEGVYIFPLGEPSEMQANTFIIITNATTNASFRVAVANGYSQPIFLETSHHNFFRGFNSTKTFYDHEGESIGHHVEGGSTYGIMGPIPGVRPNKALTSTMQ